MTNIFIYKLIHKKAFAILFVLLAMFLFPACERDDRGKEQTGEWERISIHVTQDNYEGEAVRSPEENESFDRIEHLIITPDGKKVPNIKSQYFPEKGQIIAEGLLSGEYKLLVLGIRGNEEKDQATIHPIESENDVWLSFPENLSQPLQAEYFYAQTSFRVIRTEREGREVTFSDLTEIRLKRLVGKIEFEFEYNNTYTRTAIQEIAVDMTGIRFHTEMTAKQTYQGSSNGKFSPFSLMEQKSCLFMPTVTEEGKGSLQVTKKHYTGKETKQTYTFSFKIQPNHKEQIHTLVHSEDDREGIVYATQLAYEESKHFTILSDTESKDVFYDSAQRSFNINEPLQVKLTEDGKLHTRFYSVRPVTNMMIYARIKKVSEEWLEFAFYDEIPAFGDAEMEIPLLNRDVLYRTESGQVIQVPRQKDLSDEDIEFKLHSNDEYWQMIRKIKARWYIYFASYGANPDLPDGGPNGNYRGMRPVHIREFIAWLTNVAYMWELPECEQAMRDYVKEHGNFHDDYNNPVEISTVMRQLRELQGFQLGIVKPGAIAGLGGGWVYALAQFILVDHYVNSYYCSMAFHELGHCMGYNHQSSFTYGSWAEEVMNEFYVKNIERLPVNSPHYLNTKNNPNLYTT